MGKKTEPKKPRWTGSVATTFSKGHAVIEPKAVFQFLFLQ
jgi:hypothetical protein